MWPTKRGKIDIAGPIVAKSYPIKQAVRMGRYSSLININPSGITHFSRKKLTILHVLICYTHTQLRRPYGKNGGAPLL